MRIVGEAPDPIAPARHIRTEPLPAAIFKKASETTDAAPRRWRAQVCPAHQVEDVDEQRCIAVLPRVRDLREGRLGFAIVESGHADEQVDIDAAGWQLSC